jgi:hypothetical protein
MMSASSLANFSSVITSVVYAHDEHGHNQTVLRQNRNDAIHLLRAAISPLKDY